MSLLKRRMLFGRAWALGGWKVLALTGLATSPYQGVYSPPGLWCGYGQPDPISSGCSPITPARIAAPLASFFSGT
jgi:hypothetical protein